MINRGSHDKNSNRNNNNNNYNNNNYNNYNSNNNNKINLYSKRLLCRKKLMQINSRGCSYRSLFLNNSSNS